LADVPRQSPQLLGVRRFLHRANHPVSDPVRVLGTCSRPTPDPACNVTAHPTAEWTAQQLREAFPFDHIPRYLLRDRDGIFGSEFRKDVEAMGIQEVLSAPRSPWQRAYIERVIGTIRRDCLDHVIVLSETSLRRTLAEYLRYYHQSRTHLSLSKDAPDPRPVQPPELGPIIAIPQVGGLHHRYQRHAA
jgi:putative transposase